MYETLQEVLGDEHPFTLCAANNYASCLVLDHKLSPARELCDRTLEISRGVRGDRHPDTLACAVNAAFTKQATEGDAAAQRSIAEALGVLAQVLGPNHPDTIDATRGKRAECDIEPPPT